MVIGADTVGVTCGNTPTLVATCESFTGTLAGTVFTVGADTVVETGMGHTSDWVMVLATAVRVVSATATGRLVGSLFCAHLWMRLLNATKIPAISAYPSPVAMYPVIAGAKMR